jgi:peptide deformylase
MPFLTIRIFPDKILRKKARKLTFVSAADREDLARMAEVMYLSKGVGLAAVQVGIDKQLAVVDIGEGLMKMVNPSITDKSGFEICEEGCLSVPGVGIKVKRAKLVTVSYLNESGEAVQLRAEGLLARAIQHEIDHLCGVLIIDYTNPIKNMLIRTKLSGRKKRR